MGAAPGNGENEAAPPAAMRRSRLACLKTRNTSAAPLCFASSGESSHYTFCAEAARCAFSFVNEPLMSISRGEPKNEQKFALARGENHKPPIGPFA